MVYNFLLCFTRLICDMLFPPLSSFVARPQRSKTWRRTFLKHY
jgi:hypothetical protein